MDSKQIVLSGLVVTALLTALTLSGWVADMVMAFFILSAGILLTCFIALNQRRREYSAHLSDLLKSLQEIGQQDNMEEAGVRLAGWVKRLLKMPLVLVTVSGPVESSAGDLELRPLIDAFNLDGNQALAEISRDDNSTAAWPPGVAWAAGYKLEGYGRLALILADRQPRRLEQEDKEKLEKWWKQWAALFAREQERQRQQAEIEVIIKTLLAGTEAYDPKFVGHSGRVGVISRLIAGKLGLSEEEIRALAYAAWLHDIGKGAEAAVPADTGSEADATGGQPEAAGTYGDHASLGAEMIPADGIFSMVKEAVRHHHERYDGSGYPLGLSHTDIPFLARIIAVADVYDALTRLAGEEAMTSAMAVRAIRKATGTLFDPLVVVALEETAEEIAQLTLGNELGEPRDFNSCYS